MIYAAFIGCFAIGYLIGYTVGYRVQGLKEQVKKLEIASKRTKSEQKGKTEEPKSILIDPTDEIAEARYQQEKIMKQLNPTQDEEQQ